GTGRGGGGGGGGGPGALPRGGGGAKGTAARARGGGRGRGEREPHRTIGALGGLLAALDRGNAAGQRFEIAAIDRGRRFLRELGNLRGAGVGAHARFAGSGERLVVAATESAHGFGQRLHLGFERGEAGGERGIDRALRRRGAGGFELGDAARHRVERFRIDGRRRRARGEIAQLELDAGEARVELAHAVVTAQQEARGP